MRGNKRLVQGIAVASMTGVLVFSALPQQPIMKTEETIQITQNGTAAAVMSDEYINEIFTQALSIEKNDAYQVSTSAIVGKSVIEKPAIIEQDRADKKKSATKNTKKDEKKNKESNQKTDNIQKQGTNQKTDDNKLDNNKDETNKQNNTEKTEKKSSENVTVKKKNEQTENKSDRLKETDEKDKKKSSEKDKWTNKLMADVDKSLNIRKSDNIDAQVIGKLRKGDVATVLKKGKKWTKVKSGSVTGFVKNNYCVYGDKAYKLANKVCDTYATVKADGLRIRQKADENATILRAVEEGDKLVVNTDKKEKDGWVAVQVHDTKGYVSSDYVDVALGTGKAITIEEEQAQIAAKQKAAQEAAAISSQSSSAAPTVSTSVQVSPSDLTLLSAIIFCEAGGESYEGQVAVGAVVMNRVKSSSYPNSISGVVYQSGQFSPVANGSLSRALSNGNYTHCTSAAQAALAGSDNTGGAKFFHRVNGDAGLVIGNHVFY